MSREKLFRELAAKPAGAEAQAGESGWDLRNAALMRRAVQMYRSAGKPAEATHSKAQMAEAATRGTEGTGEPLPHLAAIQQSVGAKHDLSDVRAHVGGEAAAASDELGAEGFAVGQDVAFARAPDLRLAAHEAAHVVQQRSGVQLDGGVGDVGDQHEKNADAVADRVVAGQSAEDLLPAPAGEEAAGVQRFSALGEEEQGESNWVTNAPAGVRVSDDGNLAVAQHNVFGSQELYADEGMIEAASAELQAATSVIRLEATNDTISGKVPGSESQKTLKRVMPKNKANNTEGAGAMQLWADCGKSNSDVMGASQGTGDGQRQASFKGADGGEKKTQNSDPLYMKWEIMAEHFKDRIAWGEVEQLKAKLDEAYAELGAVQPDDDEAKEIAEFKIAQLQEQMTQLIFAEYDQLPLDKKEEFDEKVGINRHAMPKIGQGFTISTGGAAQEGMEKSTWNFHWGGVVMRSGGDAVVLENYAVGDPDVENSKWKFQMYGPPSKKGQTFHDTHKDKLGQHGDSPTTMVVEGKK